MQLKLTTLVSLAVVSVAMASVIPVRRTDSSDDCTLTDIDLLNGGVKVCLDKPGGSNESNLSGDDNNTGDTSGTSTGTNADGSDCTARVDILGNVVNACVTAREESTSSSGASDEQSGTSTSSNDGEPDCSLLDASLLGDAVDVCLLKRQVSTSADFDGSGSDNGQESTNDGDTTPSQPDNSDETSDDCTLTEPDLLNGITVCVDVEKRREVEKPIPIFDPFNFTGPGFDPTQGNGTDNCNGTDSQPGNHTEEGGHFHEL